MAFKGDLKNISLFDVLQTLNQNKQTGVLVVQRNGATKKIFIDTEGVRVFFTRSFRPLRLGEIFVRRGRITPQDVEIVLLQQKQKYVPIGELLVASGKITQEEVDQVLRYHAEDEIYEIFAWEHGTFAFCDGQTAEENASTPLSAVLLDPASLCLEAARRLDVIERCRQEVPDNECYFIQIGDLEPDRELNSGAVCDVFDALADPNTVNDLRDLVGLSLYEVLDAVVQLVGGNMVRMFGPAELLKAGLAAADGSDDERTAHMLEKAHELDPTNVGTLKHCIDAVKRMDDPRRLSAHLATLGQLYLESGHAEDAIELLEQALRHDPDNRLTLSSLRDACAELGNAERAVEISLRLARSLADDGDLDDAIQACRDGQAVSPANIALSYTVAQFLARANRGPEARQELRELIREAANSASRKSQELLTSCYRLLLKIDPADESAHRGLRGLDRRRVASLRKKKLIVMGSIAAALLAVVGVVGLASRGPGSGPEEMLASVRESYARHDERGVRERAGDLVETHPDSPEAQLALGLLSEIQKEQRAIADLKAKRNKAIKADLEASWKEIRDALNGRPYLEGLALITPFLKRLNKPDAVFLRTPMKVNFEHEFSEFLQRVLKQYRNDRDQMALAETQLRKSMEPTQTVRSLKELDVKLSRLRARNWTQLVPQILERLARIAAEPQAGKGAKDSVDGFRKKMGKTYASFASLDTLNSRVRSKRLRLEITEAVAQAREQRMELLQRCEFAKARELYATAFERANAVTDEEPREHFLELIKWLDSTNMLEDMREKRNEIDNVVATLKEVERLRKAKQISAAFRLFISLVNNYPVIQFEREYKAPYVVRSTPTDATVYLDGERVGQTPVEIELDIVEKVGIVVKRDGFSDTSAQLVATDPGLTGELHLELIKKTAWERSIQGEVEAPLRIAKTDDRELLLIVTSNADLIALDLKTGEPQWVAETKLLDRITAAPVATEHYAYVIFVSGLLLRVRLSDGTILKKRVKLPGHVNHDAAYDGKTLYIATQDRRLLAVLGTKVVYDLQMRFAPTTRLVHSNGRLFVGTAEGVILVHDAKTGKALKELGTRGASSFLGGITGHKGLVVAGAEDGSLYAFDIASSQRLWRYPTVGPVTAPPVSGKYIFVPVRDGYVHALDMKGKPAIRFELDGQSESAPAVANGFLYAVGGDRVTAFDTDEERAWWEFEFPAADGVPEHVVVGGGHIVVVSSASRVVAFPQGQR